MVAAVARLHDAWIEMLDNSPGLTLRLWFSGPAGWLRGAPNAFFNGGGFIGAACVICTDIAGTNPGHGDEERVSLLAPAIGRVAPGCDQQRHVEMALGIAHRKPHGNAVEERRIRHRHLPRGKIVADGKRQFVAPDRQAIPADQRLIRCDHHCWSPRASPRGCRQARRVR